jgi:hypothetical protein
MDGERDAEEHYEADVGGQRGTVFVDRVFDRAERESAVLGGAVEDPVFSIEVGEVRWCHTCCFVVVERRWKMTKIVLDFGRGGSISTEVEVNVTDEFGKDDDTTFGETCWIYGVL